LKIILGIGEVLREKLLIYNLLFNNQLVIDLTKVQDEIDAIVEIGEDGFEDVDYQHFCGIDQVPSISVMDFLENRDDYIAIDIREKSELPRLEQYDVQECPQSLWVNNVLTKDKTVLICQSGVRSRALVKQLMEVGFDNLINLQGGVNELMKAGY